MWAEWVGRMVKKWVVVEHPVWSVKMGVAGTIDRVALLRGERSLTIVDIKTGTLTDDIGERLAGYRMMWNEMGRLVVGDAFKKVQRTLAVSIPRDGGSLSVKEYDPARYEKQFALRVSDYHELVQQ
jgi:hypothetical protein